MRALREFLAKNFQQPRGFAVPTDSQVVRGSQHEGIVGERSGRIVQPDRLESLDRVAGLVESRFAGIGEVGQPAKRFLLRRLHRQRLVEFSVETDLLNLAGRCEVTDVEPALSDVEQPSSGLVQVSRLREFFNQQPVLIVSLDQSILHELRLGQVKDCFLTDRVVDRAFFAFGAGEQSKLLRVSLCGDVGKQFGRGGIVTVFVQRLRSVQRVAVKLVPAGELRRKALFLRILRTGTASEARPADRIAFAEDHSIEKAWLLVVRRGTSDRGRRFEADRF